MGCPFPKYAGGKGKINMTILTIGGKDYSIKFNYNCFCDTDLLDRVNDLGKLFHSNGTGSDKDVSAMGKIKDLFVCVRDLLFTGMQEENPVENVQEVGKLLDQYKAETPEGEKRGILQLFVMLSNELTEEGFLADLMETLAETPSETQEKAPKTPQDHKKKQK
jgi:hypothetical protein